MTTDRPLISVIVPVYNIKEYLPRCVESICRQTYENLEVLLVDDGSTDGTGQLCDQLSAQDPRIRVFHKENGGSSCARNLGIRESKGQYLGFVDSDDYISADMYERLLEGLLKYRVPIAQVGRDEIDENGDRRPDICIPPKQEEQIASGDFLRELLLHKGDCSFCTKLVDKRLFQDREFPLGVLNEDFHLLVKMLPEIEGILSLPGYGYHVFYRMGSNTRKQGKNAFSRVYGDNVDNADMVAQMVEQTYPELKKIALRFGLFQRLDYLLHIPISLMNRENDQYQRIVSHVRRHWLKGMGNPYLTGKNKIYLTLFAVAPKGIRQLHRRFKGIE